MLKVKVTVEPNGDPDRTTIIGTLAIENKTGNDASIGHYECWFMTIDERHNNERVVGDKSVVVENYDRSQGFWCLIREAINRAYPET